MAKQTTMYFEVKQGVAEPVRADKIGLPNGKAVPTGDDVVRFKKAVPAGVGVVLYPTGSVRPSPTAGAFAVEPGQFGPQDLKNIVGPVLPFLMEQALKLQTDAKWTLKDILLVVLSGVGALTGSASLIIVYKGLHHAGLI